MVDVTSGMVVHEAIIAKNMRDELPFMATENVMMAAVQAGGDRQALHEKIRQLSLAAARRMKEEGAENDLVSRMQADPELGPHVDASALDPSRYVGRAPAQVGDFLDGTLTPLLEQHAHRAGRFTPRVRV